MRAGYLKPEHYFYIPGLIAVAFVGSYLGKLVLKRLNQEQFRRFVLFLVLLISLVLVGRSVYELTRSHA